MFPILLALTGTALLAWLAFSTVWLRRARRTAREHAAVAQTLRTQLPVDLFRLGRRDTLTGLASRPAFLDTLAARMAGGRRITLAVIDLRRFAEIDAAQGEGVGDELLCAVANRLLGLAATREHAARLDGDEFAILLDDGAEGATCRALAERLFAVMSCPYPASGRLVDLPLAIGLASAPDQATTARGLVRAAHTALHHAKTAPGSQWRINDQELDRLLERQERFRAALKRAVGQGQIIPWYQPIVDVKSGAIAKFEVLARWNHPELGVLAPDQFIALAEEIGIAGDISMALLCQVGKDCREWPNNFRFAFNVSAGQVRELIGFLNRAPGEWQRRIDMTRFDVEITEDALLADRAMARELIDTLHEHGARAGLDDFGSGTSNFAFLRDMPFDTIKIGKPFIATMLQDARAEACVLAMLWLGRGLGIEVVADGVETQDVATRLAEIGCNYAQGFFYARPVPAEDVAFLLRQPNLLGRKPTPREAPIIRLAS